MKGNARKSSGLCGRDGKRINLDVSKRDCVVWEIRSLLSHTKLSLNLVLCFSSVILG